MLKTPATSAQTPTALRPSGPAKRLTKSDYQALVIAVQKMTLAAQASHAVAELAMRTTGLARTQHEQAIADLQNTCVSMGLPAGARLQFNDAACTVQVLMPARGKAQ